MPTRSGQIAFRMLANKLLRVTFSEDILVDGQESNVGNYQVTIETVGADAVNVQSVQGFITSEYSTLLVDLVLSQPTLGATYLLTVSDMALPDGYTLTDLTGQFVASTTKADSMRQVFPSWYNFGPTTIINHVLLAMSIEDEKVGG